MNRRKISCARPITHPTFVRVDEVAEPDEEATTLEERLILLIYRDCDAWQSLLSDEDSAKIDQWVETGEVELFREVFDRFYKQTVEDMIAYFNHERQEYLEERRKYLGDDYQ